VNQKQTRRSDFRLQPRSTAGSGDLEGSVDLFTKRRIRINGSIDSAAVEKIAQRIPPGGAMRELDSGER
jgi:hypothetical protein